MKAMVLAAGLGTRLRPLTDDRPKALVEVAGRTLLEIVLERLRSFGVRDVIVNVHHYAEMVVKYLEANRYFGMRIEVSLEEALLDTGGGLKKAAKFFLDGADDAQESFLVHNVDVVSSIDFAAMVRLHTQSGALATLAVQKRQASRYLLFEDGRLSGRQIGPLENAVNDSDPASQPTVEALGFCGVHVISPRLLTKLEEDGAFSIINAYVHLAARGETIIPYRADEAYWCDLGRPESIVQASLDMESGRLN